MKPKEREERFLKAYELAIANQKGVDMTASEYRYMATIAKLSARDGAARMADVASELGFARASVYKKFCLLEQQGLIVKRDDKSVVMTAEGEKRFAEQTRLCDVCVEMLAQKTGMSEALLKYDAIAVSGAAFTVLIMVGKKQLHLQLLHLTNTLVTSEDTLTGFDRCRTGCHHTAFFATVIKDFNQTHPASARSVIQRHECAQGRNKDSCSASSL